MSFSEITTEVFKALSINEIGIDEPNNYVATPEDIRERIIYQHETYLKREKAGELSRNWMRYERRHSEEINAIRQRLENEASF